MATASPSRPRQCASRPTCSTESIGAVLSPTSRPQAPLHGCLRPRGKRLPKCLPNVPGCQATTSQHERGDLVDDIRTARERLLTQGSGVRVPPRAPSLPTGVEPRFRPSLSAQPGRCPLSWAIGGLSPWALDSQNVRQSPRRRSRFSCSTGFPMAEVAPADVPPGPHDLHQGVVLRAAPGVEDDAVVAQLPAYVVPPDLAKRPSMVVEYRRLLVRKWPPKPRP